MAATNIPPSYAVNESSLFKILLPNRGRTRFIRAAILLFEAVGVLAWIAIGARILRLALPQRTRWFNGRTYLWIGRTRETGRGQGNSNLRFDQIEPLTNS